MVPKKLEKSAGQISALVLCSLKESRKSSSDKFPEFFSAFVGRVVVTEKKEKRLSTNLAVTSMWIVYRLMDANDEDVLKVIVHRSVIR